MPKTISVINCPVTCNHQYDVLFFTLARGMFACTLSYVACVVDKYLKLLTILIINAFQLDTSAHYVNYLDKIPLYKCIFFLKTCKMHYFNVVYSISCVLLRCFIILSILRCLKIKKLYIYKM